MKNTNAVPVKVCLPAAKIKCLLADDHPLLRAGVRATLKTTLDIVVIGEASNGHEAVELAKTECPDILLFDINMAGMSGIEATKSLHRAGCTTKLIALSMHQDLDYVEKIIEYGAKGCILKSSPTEHLITGVREVAKGGVYFSPEIIQLLSRKAVHRETQAVPRRFRLSAREKEVVVLIADGRRNKDIADQLKVSVRTIETHRSRIMRKLQIDNVARLTRFAIDSGLLLK